VRSGELNIDADKAAGDVRRIIFPSPGQYWGVGMRFAGTQDVLVPGFAVIVPDSLPQRRSPRKRRGFWRRVAQ